MLYLGIDQHKSLLTVNVRGEDGEVVLKRQVSTRWEKVRGVPGTAYRIIERARAVCMLSPDQSASPRDGMPV
jgi:hypothetical protein